MTAKRSNMILRATRPLTATKNMYGTASSWLKSTIPTAQCVADEIKLHYLAWKGVKWIDTNWNIIAKKSEEVNIYEQDVTNWNRFALSYRDGIRAKYKNTLADPFYDPQKKDRTNKVREEWKTQKIPDSI